MALSLVTAPTAEPVRLDDVKSHVRIAATVTDDDPMIGDLISAAAEYVEHFVHRKLITQTWDLKLDGFPAMIALPFPPVQSVSITYVDTAGATQTLAASTYTTDFASGPLAMSAYIVPAYGQYWPSTRAVPNAVTVRFVCGYGDKENAVPWSIKTAIKLMVQHWYDVGRQPVIVGTIVSPVPKTVDDLLWPYKAFGFGCAA